MRSSIQIIKAFASSKKEKKSLFAANFVDRMFISDSSFFHDVVTSLAIFIISTALSCPAYLSWSSIDLFLRYYFLGRKKDFTGEERAYVVQHVYSMIRWMTYLGYLGRKPINWYNKLDAYEGEKF